MAELVYALDLGSSSERIVGSSPFIRTLIFIKMNITKENAENNLTATIKIELVKADYDANVDKVLKDYQKRANMPGFRPGKVPFALVSKMYRPSVIADEVNKLISSELSKYIDENNMKILGNPMTNFEKQDQINFDTEDNFVFYFDVALEPEVDIILDDSIIVQKYDINIDDDMVGKYVVDTRNRMGNDIEPETSEMGDVITGTFQQLNENKELLVDGITNHATLDLNKISDEEKRKKFIGLKVNDVVTFNLITVFEDENDVAIMLNINANIAKNMKSDFNFTVDKITRRVPAEITEEFFDKIYPGKNIHSMAEFEDKIRQDAKISFSSETDKKFMSDCIDALIAKYNFPLPDDFMKRWILSNQKEDSKNPITKENIDANYVEYSKSIRWQVIENLIITKYQLDVTKDDVRNHLINLFLGQLGSEDPEAKKRAEEYVDRFMENDKNGEQIKSVYDHIIDKNLINLFSDKLKVEIKPITYTDFIKVLYPIPEQTPNVIKTTEEAAGNVAEEVAEQVAVTAADNA